MTILYVLAGIVLLLLAASWGSWRYVFHSPNRDQNDDYKLYISPQTAELRDTILDMIRKLNEIPYEKVSITSQDGLRLAGRYYHQKDGAPLDICFHGYRGTPSRDFSGGTAIYRSAGHNLLMVEQRAQCGSEGNTITFGVMERRDCLAWARWAAERFGPETPILLAGISMGAATVLMASALDLPENVRGIIADCPYTSPEAIIRKVGGDMKLPVELSWPVVRLSARLWGGFDPADPDADAARAVQRAKVPILLIHGEDDRFVPCDMSRAIAAANPEAVELHTFPGAGHGLSYLVDPERYTALVRGFMERVLPEADRSRAEGGERLENI